MSSHMSRSDWHLSSHMSLYWLTYVLPYVPLLTDICPPICPLLTDLCPTICPLLTDLCPTICPLLTDLCPPMCQFTDWHMSIVPFDYNVSSPRTESRKAVVKIYRYWSENGGAHLKHMILKNLIPNNCPRRFFQINIISIFVCSLNILFFTS